MISIPPETLMNIVGVILFVLGVAMLVVANHALRNAARLVDDARQIREDVTRIVSARQ